LILHGFDLKPGHLSPGFAVFSSPGKDEECYEDRLSRSIPTRR
jgi:hypothetical protein